MSFSSIEILEEFVEASYQGKVKYNVELYSYEYTKARWRRHHHNHMDNPSNRETKRLRMIIYRLKKSVDRNFAIVYPK